MSIRASSSSDLLRKNPHQITLQSDYTVMEHKSTFVFPYIDGLPNQTSICQLVVTCLALLANEHTGFAFPRLQMGLIVWHLAHLGITDGTSFGAESLATDRWLLTGAVTRLPYVQFSFCFSRDSWEDTFLHLVPA